MTDPGEAVEALAREMGWYAKAAGFDPGVTPWAIDCTAMTYGNSPHVLIQKLGTDGRYSENWRVTPPEALLLLHLARLGPTREPCPDCRATGAEWTLRFHQAWGAAFERDDYDKPAWQKQYARESEVWTLDEWLDIVYGPCPTCTGPAVECEGCERGRVSDCEASELAAENLGCGLRDDGKKWHVLDCVVDDCEGCSGTGTVPGKPAGWVTREHGWVDRWLRERSQPIDPEARADLWVLADQLQDKPDPIGDVLALWLSGAPCDECDGHGAPLAATLYKYFEHAIAERWELTPDSASRVKADLCAMVRDAGFPARDIEVTVDLDRRSFQVDGMDDLADWSTCSCKGQGKAYAAQLIEASP